MVVYNRKLKHVEAFDYRETGPANMTMDIYNGWSDSAKVGKSNESSSFTRNKISQEVIFINYN